jgi:phosphopantetheine adenylyltransferase
VIAVYSPKLSEELVPVLYRIAQAKKITMVKLVNDIVSEAVRDIKVEAQIVSEETEKMVYVMQEEKNM